MLSYSDKVKKKKKNSGSSFAEKVLNGTYESPFSRNNASKVKVETTTNTSKKKNTSWANSLDDGYDFGDVTKTILGTTKNVIFGNDEKEDIAPVKNLSKKDEDKEISKYYKQKDYSSLTSDELKEEESKLQKQINKQQGKLNKTAWWDSGDNILENAGNVLYKAFAEKDPNVKDDEYYKYQALLKQAEDLKSQKDTNTVKNTKYDDGFLGFVEKTNDTTVGNVMTGVKGIESVANKILGVETDSKQTIYEKQSEKARSESDGAMGVYLDAWGSVARMTPQLMVGNPTGATVLGFANYGGGAYNEAKREGYTEEQATKYGIATGTLEMATEKALGAFGDIYGKTKLGNATQGVIDKFIPKVIKNKQVRNIMANMGSEAAEEFLQEYIGNVTKDTLLDEKGFLKSTWKNISDPEVLSDALYSAFVGGITGGALSTPGQIDAYKYEKATGRNAETGLTANEQSVMDSVVDSKKTELQKQKAVDNEVNKIIKEQEKTFGTLTNAEKKGIKQQVQERLDNGEIDYSTAKLSEKEISKISNQVKSDLQKGYIGTDVIENTLGKDSDLSLDTYLQNSYKEKGLKSKQFTYTASENDSEFRKELAKTTDVLNDSTRSHELFDTVAKISEDRGTKYGFVNNEKLKSLGHYVEGKTINGLVRVNEDGTQKVLINVDSDKALNTILGHETTHLLEGTEEYNALQNAVKEYAKNKGDYDSKYNQINDLYKGTNANVDNEVTSDLVGDYLFTDQEFVNNLSSTQPGVFQKVYDYIKHVYNLATAGSKEARQLEELKYRFDQAYKQNASNMNETDTKYSLISDNANKTYLQEINKTKAEQMKEQGKTDKEIWLATGYQYNNGQWQTEVNDARFKRNGQLETGKEYKLSDVVDADEVFKAYPDLKDVKVSKTDMTSLAENEEEIRIAKGLKGATTQDGNILISDTIKSGKAAEEVLNHEIQHLIQDIEGMQTNTASYLMQDKNGSYVSKESLQKYLNDAAEMEARQVQNRVNMSNEERQSILPKETDTKVDMSKYSLSEAKPLEQRVSGDTLLDAQDLIEEIRSVGANVDENGYVTLYHATTPENAEKIKSSGKMISNEPDVFFSTSKNAQQSEGRGGVTLEFKIPAEKLELDDLFSDNADVKIPLKNFAKDSLDVSDYLVTKQNTKYSLSEDINSLKNKQYKIIENSNPVEDDYHTWIRSTDDIKTFEETLNDPDWVDYREEGFDPDYTGDMINEALETGKITVYSSYPIEQGIFVTPSQMEAETYSGNGKVYSKEVNLTDVAWIDPTQGQYAKVDTDYSLSKENDAAPRQSNLTYGEDVKLQQQIEDAVAPLKEEIKTLNKTISDLQENIAPINKEVVEQEASENLKSITDEDIPVRNNLTTEESKELDTYENFPFNLDESEKQRVRELQQKEQSTPDEKVTESESLFDKRNYEDVGNKKVNAYQYDNPEVKPYFQEEAKSMLYDLKNSVKGEKLIIGDISQTGGGNYEYSGTKRTTTPDIAEMLDGVDGKYKLSYADIEKGLNAIIKDEGAENNAASKRIEFYLDQRLREGYTGLDGIKVNPNQEYINTLNGVEAYNNWQKTTKNLEAPIENVSYTENATRNVPNTNENTTGNINTLENEKVPVNKFNEVDTESIERDPIMEFVQNEIDRKEAKAKAKEEAKKNKKTVITKEKGKVRKAVDTAKNLFVNRNVEIDNLAKESGNLNIKYAGDMLNSVAGEIENEISTSQTNNEGKAIGKSINQIFKEAKKSNLYDAFNDYLIQYSNIDRHVQGKGSQIPLNVSQQLVQDYESSYPQFKEWGNDVWNYGKNARQNMKDAGLISDELNNTLESMYPHYVPYMSDEDVSKYVGDLGELKPKGVIKRAKGGAGEVLPVEEALTEYTYAYKKAVRQNELYRQIVGTLSDKVNIGADVRSDPSDLNESLYRDENGNYLTAYVNGKQQSARISDDLYNGLKNELETTVKNLESKFEILTKPLQKASNIRRNLLTTWSPTFIITNPVKDIQDALLNSKHTAKFIKNYPLAFKELAQGKTDLVQQFTALYGSGNAMGEYDVDSGLYKPNSKNRNFLKGISRVNDIMELAPRYAEFKSSIESGESVQQAMYNAREITTNFGRGGVITKALNRNGFTFLNASVQGFDKFVRNFSGENGAKGVASSLLKATAFGVAPALFNELVFGAGDDDEKDEDYAALPNYIKDNYYLIKTSDGNFVRIPKGRALTVFGSAARRTLEYANGEHESLQDAFKGYLSNVNSQVGISNPEESNIFAPFIQAKNNESWYGGDLVPTRLQDKPAAEQYDASTDKFSIWLGDKLNISPYKINYVLDQYSGGIGDMILPTITEEAQSGTDSKIGTALAPLKDKFTADSTTDNKYVSDFYTKNDELQVKANSSKATEEDTLREKYMYSVSKKMGELYQERRDVQSDSSLSKSEKYKKSQAIKEQINSLAKEGLDNYQKLNKTENYAIIGDQEYYLNAKGQWSNPNSDDLDTLNSFGLDIDEKSEYFSTKNKIYEINNEYKNILEFSDEDDKYDIYVQKKADIIDAIKDTNVGTFAKAYLYDKQYGDTDTLDGVISMGIDMDKYLDLEKQNFTSDKYANGKTVSGSKKRKIFNYINSMDIPFEQKIVLAKLKYKSYDEYNYEIVDYLNNNDNFTYESQVNFLKKMGFKVYDDGTVEW